MKSKHDLIYDIRIGAQKGAFFLCLLSLWACEPCTEMSQPDGLPRPSALLLEWKTALKDTLFQTTDSVWVVLYHPATLQASAYIHLQKNTLSGYWKAYHPNAYLQAQGYIREGEKQGWWEEYYENGQTARYGHYTQGQKQGYWREFYPQGTLAHEGYYQQDQKSGWWVMYDLQGRIEAKGRYLKGEKDGYWHFYTHSKPVQEGFFCEGKPCQWWKIYDEQGNIVQLLEKNS